MPNASLRRWMPVTGIVFAILFVAGLATLQLPDGSDASVLSFYADKGDRFGIIVNAYLLVIAGLAFVCFLADLWLRLRGAQGRDTVWSTISLVSGALFVATLIIAAALIASMAGNVAFGGDPQPASADVARFIPETGYGVLFLAGALMAGLHLASTAAAALESDVLPRWLAWLALPLAVIVLFGVLFIPMVALPLWVLITSIVLLMRGRAIDT